MGKKQMLLPLRRKRVLQMGWDERRRWCAPASRALVACAVSLCPSSLPNWPPVQV